MAEAGGISVGLDCRKFVAVLVKQQSFRDALALLSEIPLLQIVDN